MYRQAGHRSWQNSYMKGGTRSPSLQVSTHCTCISGYVKRKLLQRTGRELGPHCEIYLPCILLYISLCFNTVK